jgi:hypothetical protein
MTIAKVDTHPRRWSAVKASTIVSIVLAVIGLPLFYWWYFQNYNLHFVYLPVVVPLVLVAVVGVVYSLTKKNHDLLAYFIILFFSAIFVGYLYRGIFLPIIIVD